MGAWGLGHWLVVLAIVLLVFGTKRLTSGAKDLGNAVKEFKKGMRDDDKPAAQLGDASRRPTRRLRRRSRTSASRADVGRPVSRMFDIGFSELLVIAVVALVVLGPERLPKAALPPAVGAPRTRAVEFGEGRARARAGRRRAQARCSRPAMR
jgi:sec-independent protein translocase protein TatA